MTKKLLSVIIILCLVFALSLKASADFGDFGGDTDYGGGFDYDYGDSDYDYDYDDDDDYDYYDDDDDDDYGETNNAYYHYIGYTGGSGPSSGGMCYDSMGKAVSAVPLSMISADNDSGSSAVLGVLVLSVIAIAVVVIKRGKNNSYSYSGGDMPSGAAPTDRSMLRPMNTYIENDESFSDTELCAKISNMYVQFQNGWQSKNLEELRPYMTDEFFARMDRQLDSYRRKKQTNIIERIAVLGVELTGWTQRGDEDIIIADVKTRIVDYVIDDNTNAVVRGSDTAEKFMEYEWTLSRKSGVKTAIGTGTRSLSCPHCGAPLDINRTAKCEYCGSIVTVDSTDWAVSDMKGISQRTRR